MLRIDDATRLMIATQDAADRKRMDMMMSFSLEILSTLASAAAAEIITTGTPLRIDFDAKRLAETRQLIRARMGIDEVGVHLVFERAQ
jgi:hypothetical protein